MDYRSVNAAKARIKGRAHQMVADAIAGGDLSQQPCELCGDSKTQAHHDDYDHPLDVRWLCGTHHQQFHEENGEGSISEASIVAELVRKPAASGWRIRPVGRQCWKYNIRFGSSCLLPHGHDGPCAWNNDAQEPPPLKVDFVSAR